MVNSHLSMEAVDKYGHLILVNRDCTTCKITQLTQNKAILRVI